MTAWVAGMNDSHPDLLLSYDPVGSGTGREMFLEGATHFAGSDASLNDSEVERARQRCSGAEPIELPLYISPIAVAYNLPEVEEEVQLTPQALAAVFAGEITAWDDPEIAESNPGLDLPDLAIIPVNRSDDSGTTQNFTEYLAAAGGEAWPYEPSQTWPRGGTQSAQGSSALVQTIQAADGTIGYVDAALVSDELETAAVLVGEGFVSYDAAAAAAVVDASPPAEEASDLRLTLDLARDTDEAGVYPIVLVSYLIACSAYESEREVANVRTLLEYVASPEAQDRAARLDVAGSAPITENLREQVLEVVAQIHVVEGD